VSFELKIIGAFAAAFYCYLTYFLVSRNPLIPEVLGLQFTIRMKRKIVLLRQNCAKYLALLDSSVAIC
jgi:hypothetical protein